MSKIEKIQTTVVNFRMMCVREGMEEDELPDLIKTAFKDFEGYVAHGLVGFVVPTESHSCLFNVISAMNDCKINSKTLLARVRLVSKRSELAAAATQRGEEVVLALNIFQVYHVLSPCLRFLRHYVASFFQANLQIDQFRMIRDLRNAVMPHVCALPAAPILFLLSDCVR